MEKSDVVLKDDKHSEAGFQCSEHLPKSMQTEAKYLEQNGVKHTEENEISLNSSCEPSCQNEVVGKRESNGVHSERKSGKRRRKTTSLSPVCPVCGLTLRSGELQEHYEKEVKLLNDLNDPASKNTIKWLKRFNSTHHKKGSNSSNEKRNEDESKELERIKESTQRQENLVKVKMARRLRHAKLLLTTPHHLSQPDAGSSDCRVIKCPLCDAPIAGNDEELTDHVYRCLLKKEGFDDEAESDGESVEEYTWAGQTRIRATSLLEGGLMACGGDPIKLQMTNEDEELDIDGDIQIEYGLPQYTERDVIPCSTETPSENIAQDCIRAAISIDKQSCDSKENSRSRWSSENGSCSNEINCNGIESCETSRQDESLTTKEDLKKEIASLTDELQKEKLKCLICMEGFDTPLVSIVCWHVYCRECWMRTLGAKKLCPQCNTITSPSDLRRIYI